MNQQIQVAQDHYEISRYVSFERWQSYFNQLQEVLRLAPKNILIIGPGDSIVVNILKGYGILLKTLDIDPTSNPDYIGSIDDLPSIVNEKFDLVLCCQVLEHLPYDKFEMCLRHIESVTIRNVIISLPEKSLRFSLSLKLPFLKTKFLNFVVPFFFMSHKFDGEHYWEVGSKGYDRSKIVADMNKHFSVKSAYRLAQNPYHHFFILEKKS